MRRHLSNAAYGALDYASYPVGMLLVAPVVLHRLGAAEYGMWMVVTSVISAGGIVASGFGDAAIQRVASLRGIGDTATMMQTVRSTLAIHLVLGCVFALLVWLAAPYAAHRVVASQEDLQWECLVSLRIAAVLVLVRAVESVGVSVQRAFEQYRESVQINTVVRLLTLASAAALAATGHRVVSILVATAVFLAAGTYLQLRQACMTGGMAFFWPSVRGGETRPLLRAGVFVWLQSAGSVVFGQCDRIVLGVVLGAVAVAPYALCIQFAQPIFGFTASVLHFLFPYLSGRAATASATELRRSMLKAFACNLALIAAGAGLLMLFGEHLIRIWAGPAVARGAAGIFPLVVLGSALSGLSVTGTYALQALGRFRTVALISLTGRAAMLMVMVPMLHRLGLQGLTALRVVYGAVALLVYVPLLAAMSRKADWPVLAKATALTRELQEGVKL